MSRRGQGRIQEWCGIDFIGALKHELCHYCLQIEGCFLVCFQIKEFGKCMTG